MRVRRSVAVNALLLALVVVSGCPCGGPKPPPPPMPFTLCLQANARLNWYEGRSHGLFVRVFQLSSPEAFLQADLGALLTRKPDVPGAVGPPADRTVQPGNGIAVEILKSPDAHFVGVVGGYYSPAGTPKATRSFADLEAEEACEDLDAGEPNWVHLGANGILTLEREE